MAERRTDKSANTPEDLHDLSGDIGATDAQQCVDDFQNSRKLLAERDEARAAWQRAVADFQNYQRRAALNEQEARKQGTIGVLTSVFPMLDHFDMALTQATPDDASRRIMDGVRVIREELIKALERHGVGLINPRPNDEFDPTRHQAVAQQPAEGVDPGRISSVMQVGYSLDGRVVRSAMVTVSPNA